MKLQPAPCLRRSAAVLVLVALFISWSSPTRSETAVMRKTKVWLRNKRQPQLKERIIQPFSGIRSAHGREMGVIECWYTRADKLPMKGGKIDINIAQQRVFEQIKALGFSIQLCFLYKPTEIGLILTALDLHSPWSCLDEEVSHQLFQRVSWESTQEQGEAMVRGWKRKQKVLLQRTF